MDFAEADRLTNLSGRPAMTSSSPVCKLMSSNQMWKNNDRLAAPKINHFRFRLSAYKQ